MHSDRHVARIYILPHKGAGNQRFYVQMIVQKVAYRALTPRIRAEHSNHADVGLSELRPNIWIDRFRRLALCPLFPRPLCSGQY